MNKVFCMYQYLVQFLKRFLYSNKSVVLCAQINDDFVSSPNKNRNYFQRTERETYMSTTAVKHFTKSFRQYEYHA